MAKYKVKTPIDTFEGQRNGVLFRNGEAIIEDEKLVQIFKGHGYEVEEIKEKKETPKKTTSKTKTNSKK